MKYDDVFSNPEFEADTEYWCHSESRYLNLDYRGKNRKLVTLFKNYWYWFDKLMEANVISENTLVLSAFDLRARLKNSGHPLVTFDFALGQTIRSLSRIYLDEYGNKIQ